MAERLNSKKNQVWKESSCEQYFIKKIFSSSERFQRECFILAQLIGEKLATPAVISISEQPPILEYEYIAGDTVLEYLEKNTDEESCLNVLEKVLDWLADFYNIMYRKTGKCWILQDVHLRNFIVSSKDGRVYGVDYEECLEGSVEQDLAKILLYLVTYEPMYSPKNIKLAKGLFKKANDSWKLNQTFLQQKMEQQLVSICQRRKLPVRLAIVEEILSIF